MTADASSVSIILVNFHSAALIRRAVASVREWEKKGRPEIIIVDNSPYDEALPSLVREYPDIRVLSNPGNLGFAKACNIGVEAATGRFILLMNSDAYLVSEVLPACLSVWGRHGDCILTCTLANPDGSVQPHASRFPKLSRWLLESVSTTGVWRWWDSLPFARLAPGGTRIDWVTGAFLFTSKGVYSGMGGLPEEYFMYVEDLDFCLRARRRGIYSYCFPHQGVIHGNGGTLDHHSPLCLALGDRSRIQFVRRSRGVAQAFMLRCIFALRSALRAAVFGILALATGNERHRMRARLHRQGLGYLAGARRIDPAALPAAVSKAESHSCLR